MRELTGGGRDSGRLGVSTFFTLMFHLSSGYSWILPNLTGSFDLQITNHIKALITKNKKDHFPLLLSTR